LQTLDYFMAWKKTMSLEETNRSGAAPGSQEADGISAKNSSRRQVLHWARDDIAAQPFVTPAPFIDMAVRSILIELVSTDGDKSNMGDLVYRCVAMLSPSTKEKLARFHWRIAIPHMETGIPLHLQQNSSPISVVSHIKSLSLRQGVYQDMYIHHNDPSETRENFFKEMDDALVSGVKLSLWHWHCFLLTELSRTSCDLQ
jgi:hypothetical protein